MTRTSEMPPLKSIHAPEFYGHDNKNRNAMNSDSAARVLEEIMIHIDYHENDLNLRSFFFFLMYLIYLYLFFFLSFF